MRLQKSRLCQFRHHKSKPRTMARDLSFIGSYETPDYYRIWFLSWQKVCLLYLKHLLIRHKWNQATDMVALNSRRFRRLALRSHLRVSCRVKLCKVVSFFILCCIGRPWKCLEVWPCSWYQWCWWYSLTGLVGMLQDNCCQNQLSTLNMAKSWATEDCSRVRLHHDILLNQNKTFT